LTSLSSRSLKLAETKTPESSYFAVLEIQRKKNFFRMPDQATLEVCFPSAEDSKQLNLNSLEFGQRLRLCLTANKKRIELMCLSPDDFECCERVLTGFGEPTLRRGSHGSPERSSQGSLPFYLIRVRSLRSDWI